MVDQIGMLDASYFLYWEDTEWCIRAAEAGWKVCHVPQAKVWHKGANRNFQPKPYQRYYFTRNRLYTLEKHNISFSMRMLIIASTLRTILKWSINPKRKILREHRNALWRGLVDYLRHHYGPMRS